MNYIVSARKYRPSTFATVVGQHTLTTTLKNAIKSKQLAHAYLFCGPRGVGKTTCARIFAKTINCQNLGADFEACNECESCRGFNEQRSFNIHELDAASNNSVEGIRTLIDQVRIPPQIGQYSVYIVDEVHMLSQGAFNAFLKTLEEPPAHAIFILATTEKHKILPTILSRCQIYDFNRITIKDTVDHLMYIAKQEGISASAEALNVIAQKSDGGMRDALSTFDQLVSFCGNTITYENAIQTLNVLDYEYYFRLVDCFLKTDVAQSMLIFNEILSKGFDAQYFVIGLGSHLRDVLVSNNPETTALLEVSENIAKRYVEQAKSCTPDFLFQALSIVNECDVHYRTAKNKRLLVEIMLIKLAQILMPSVSPIEGEKKIRPFGQLLNTATSEQKKDSVGNKQESVQETTTQTAIHSRTPQKPTPTQANIKLPSISITLGNATQQQGKSEQTVPVHVAETPTITYTNERVSEEQLLKAWNKFAEQKSTNPRLASIFINHKPCLISDNSFEVHLNNSLQEKELNQVKSDVLIFLHNETKNNQLTMLPEVVEEQLQSKAFTAEEKYEKLATENPALTELKRVLNLQLD